MLVWFPFTFGSQGSGDLGNGACDGELYIEFFWDIDLCHEWCCLYALHR